MSDPATAMLDIDSIDVEEGFNPRTRFDEAAMKELVASIEQSGIASALTVRPNGGSRHVLVAGERRLIAAKRAGLKKVPVLIREKDGALAAALAENLIRADLDPVEEAKALKRLRELENLSTHKQLAARVGKSAPFVSERLRILELPEGCHAAIAAGKVPVEAEKNLRALAKVSPRVAECACELVQKKELIGREIVSSIADVLLSVSMAEFEVPPTMIESRAVRLCEVVGEEAKLAELRDTYRKARPWIDGDDIVLHFGEAEIDAARAAGKLIEFEVDHGNWSSFTRYITDRELAGDLAELVIERAASEAQERERVRAEERADSGQVELTPGERKAARAEKREADKKAKAEAERRNERIGKSLMERRGARVPKETQVNREKAVAALLLADNDDLAARGMRLVLPQLREVETKKLKSGEPRTKITYVDREGAHEYLSKRVEEASKPGQVMEILTEAFAAAVLADEAAVAQSKRIHWYSRARDRAEKLLGAEIKAARPRRVRASR